MLSIDGGVHVFSFDGACPPLTGPPVTLQFGPSTRHLEEGNYQFEYFWLNEGSKIRVDVTQLHGSSNVYILMGDQLLERLVNENHDYAYDGGFKFSLVKKVKMFFVYLLSIYEFLRHYVLLCYLCETL